MESSQQSSQESTARSSGYVKAIPLWSAQCNECSKWRVIATQEEYEEIRSKSAASSFVCSQRPNICCDNPADIEQDDSRPWFADKPNIPKTPAGFKRKCKLMKDFSKLECYYRAPNGKRLRSSDDVIKFLDENPDYKNDM